MIDWLIYFNGMSNQLGLLNELCPLYVYIYISYVVSENLCI